MPNILFDDSIPALISALRNLIGDEAVEKGIILRDVTGRLSFICAQEPKNEAERQIITAALLEALGPYARNDRVIAFINDPGANQVLQSPARLFFQVEGLACQLIDRRIVGTGWLDVPCEQLQKPPRIVFASLKGGVGRSTALAVAAADLARRNRNVLVVDLDIEAPGLGDLLLTEDRLPRFGVTDFLVENGIGGIPNELLADFVGVSSLTTGGGGRVLVVPAIGSSAINNPQNVLPKIARAMIENVSDNGETMSVADQISNMISRLVAHTGCDIVLIDSRAGLAELAAPAVLGLEATILLFGTAQLQTINGYRALFAGLRLLAKRDLAQGRSANWRLWLKAVHAKASLSSELLAKHKDNLYDLFAEELYDEDQGLAELEEVSFDIDDQDAPHSPFLIPFNQSFVDFDPVHDPSHLTQVFYEQTFRPFLDGLDSILKTTSD